MKAPATWRHLHAWRSRANDTQLGPGLPESAYCAALAIEFNLREISFVTEAPCPVVYKGQRLPGNHRADFICFDRVVVETKARTAVGPAEHAQVLSYLAASGRTTGLLLDFGSARLDYRRFVLGEPDSHA